MNIVITGSTRGIGRAVTEKFAASAHRIFLTARNNEALVRQKAQLLSKNPGLEVLIYPADLADAGAVSDFGRFINDHCPSVDILINNAGIFIPGNLLEEEENTYDLIMLTNVRSVYQLCRTIIPGMIRAGRGHVFNLCSVAGLKAYPNGGSYSVSKFALYGLTQNLRYELKDHGIKVTAVIPGATWTDSWADSGIARERLMEAEDIASMMYQASRLSAGAVVEEIVMRPQLGDL